MTLPSVSAEGPVSRLFTSASQLLATVLSLGRTRLELLTVELQIEAREAARLLVLLVVAVQAALIGLVMAAFWVIVFFWDTHRLLAAGSVTLLFLLVAAGAAGLMAHRLRTRPVFLAGTRAELRRDLDRLQGHP